MKTKTIIIAIAVAVMLGTGGLILINSKGDNSRGQADNVTIVEGKQVITINAKGGYYPRTTNAKANMPTVIKLNTQNTFDCSSSVVIPGLNYKANLQPSGETTIDVPAQQAGTSLKGLCSMGMYNFSINFN